MRWSYNAFPFRDSPVKNTRYLTMRAKQCDDVFEPVVEAFTGLYYENRARVGSKCENPETLIAFSYEYWTELPVPAGGTDPKKTIFL